MWGHRSSQRRKVLPWSLQRERGTIDSLVVDFQPPLARVLSHPVVVICYRSPKNLRQHIHTSVLISLSWLICENFSSSLHVTFALYLTVWVFHNISDSRIPTCLIPKMYTLITSPFLDNYYLKITELMVT